MRAGFEAVKYQGHRKSILDLLDLDPHVFLQVSSTLNLQPPLLKGRKAVLDAGASEIEARRRRGSRRGSRRSSQKSFSKADIEKEAPKSSSRNDEEETLQGETQPEDQMSEESGWKRATLCSRSHNVFSDKNRRRKDGKEELGNRKASRTSTGGTIPRPRCNTTNPFFSIFQARNGLLNIGTWPILPGPQTKSKSRTLPCSPPTTLCSPTLREEEGQGGRR